MNVRSSPSVWLGIGLSGGLVFGVLGLALYGAPEMGPNLLSEMFGLILGGVVIAVLVDGLQENHRRARWDIVRKPTFEKLASVADLAIIPLKIARNRGGWETQEAFAESVRRCNEEINRVSIVFLPRVLELGEPELAQRLLQLEEAYEGLQMFTISTFTAVAEHERPRPLPRHLDEVRDEFLDAIESASSRVKEYVSLVNTEPSDNHS